MSTWALLAAAGASRRMGSAVGGGSKVFTRVGTHQHPLLYYTLTSLCQSKAIDGFAFAARTQDMPELKALTESLLKAYPVVIVEGGATRQESVFQAVTAIPKSVEYVAVHDAARAFCPADCIAAVVAQAKLSQAAILAIPASATLKKVEGTEVLNTVERSQIWEAQTPQVVERKLLLEAYAFADEHGFVATDESQLLEYFGRKVRIVEGSSQNVKLTRAEDLAYAAYLASQLSDFSSK